MVVSRFFRIVLVSLFVLFTTNPSVFADTWSGETRMGINVDPNWLEKTFPNSAYIKKERDGDQYRVEAVAVLNVSAESIFKASLDYSHYKDFAPFVRESRIVEPKGSAGQYPPPRDLYIWTKMGYPASILGIKKTMVTSYYLHVQPLQMVVSGGDFALRWVLEPKHEDWTYPVDSYFSILDGSWYILPLGESRCFIRYFIRMRTDTVLPNAVVESAIGESLVPNIRKLIFAIADRASKIQNSGK